MKNTEKTKTEIGGNQVANNRFILPNEEGDFPAGWIKASGGKSAEIRWQEIHDKQFAVMINNKQNQHLASICQEHGFYISVEEHQLWEAGAYLYTDQCTWAIIKIHFVCENEKIVSSIKRFYLKPGYHYCNGNVTVPQNAHLAYIEIGTKNRIPIWINEAIFKRILIPRICSVNVCRVHAVKKVIDPVITKRQVRNIFNDVIAFPNQQNSPVHDVLGLDSYTLSVINLGKNSAIVRLQSSPDRIHYMDEPMEDVQIDPGQVRAFMTNCLLQYVRILYWTESDVTKLRIYLQGQT